MPGLTLSKIMLAILTTKIVCKSTGWRGWHS